MAKKRGGGFKAPSNYDPSRKPKTKKLMGKRAQQGDRVERSERAEGRADSRSRGDFEGRGSAHTGAPRGAGSRSGGPRSAGSRSDSGARVYSFGEGGAPKQRSGRPANSASHRAVREHDRVARVERPERLRNASHGSTETSAHRAGERRASRTATPTFAELETRKTSIADTEGVGFGDLGLGPNIVRVLGELGAESPFPIQVATIPDAIRGHDVLGRARTGSGKTIAFGAALVERMLKLKAEGVFADPVSRKQKPKRGERQRAPKRPLRNPKALILAPTRELALQIDRTVQPIARSVGFYTAQLVGGVPLDPQVHALERGIDIVIGTPGRVQDLVNRRKLDLREVVISVVDEADHMCDLGFLEPVQRVLRDTVRKGQRLLFSATLDTAVASLVDEFLHDPVAHEIEEHGGSAGDAEHRVLLVLREDKDDVLRELASQRGRILVFCRTRAYAERVTEMLLEAGVAALPLHGDLKQHVRERNLERFAAGKSSVLVATDVAARGIHVDDVDLVVQADPPDDFKTYLHRAGRTARAGRSGRVITVIPRTRQKRTRELLEQAGIEPAYFGDYPSTEAGI